MISNENLIFLNQKFGIQCSQYSKEKLNEILDELIDELDVEITEKEKNNLELLKKIVLNSKTIDIK